MSDLCQSPCDSGWSWYDDSGVREQRRILKFSLLQKHLEFYQCDLTSFQEVCPSSHPPLLQILSKDDPLLTKISSDNRLLGAFIKEKVSPSMKITESGEKTQFEAEPLPIR